MKERLQAAGKNPADPAVVQEVYEGMFQRIAKTHPLDYYWLWTPRELDLEPVTQQQIDAVMADFRAAIAAAKKVNAPFTLATCGWVLGPPQSPALVRQVAAEGHADELHQPRGRQHAGRAGIRQVAGRPKWAIPWMEDDPG